MIFGTKYSKTKRVKRKASPKVIGAFVSAILILLLAMVAFLGKNSLFTASERYILFFDQSINGLVLGSPVKFRGVPIGRVERVMIRSEGQRADSSAIPVVIRLNGARLQQDFGLGHGEFASEELIQLVDRGLVAQLHLESFITGQLFVELSFEPDRQSGWQPHLLQNAVISEIPTLSSSFDEITGEIAQLISEFSKIDVARLNGNVNAVLEHLATVLADVDADELTESLRALRQAAVSIEATAASLNLDHGALAGLASGLNQQVGQSLAGLDRFLGQAEALLQPDSELRYEFTNTLRELGRTAQSIRVLTDYLERNPQSLLTGRAENEK